MTRAAAAALAVGLVGAAGCPAPPRPEPPAPDNGPAIDDEDVRRQMAAELHNEVLVAYDRDEPPEIESKMILPRIDATRQAHAIGPIRIGVGPGDVLIAGELARAPSRWPLDIAPVMRTEPRSKRLEVHLSRDGSAAWVFDEISWRIAMCGRIAVIPLRLTALYARDGDRWAVAFEHLSFGHAPAPLRPGQLPPKAFESQLISKDLGDDLSRLVSPVLYRKIDRAPAVIGTGAEVMLLGPDYASEWHGPDVLAARLVGGDIKLEDRRIGLVGRGEPRATIAYWVGNVTADLPGRLGGPVGKARLRATFVFELRRVVTVQPGGRRPAADEPCPDDERRLKERKARGELSRCDWVLVQGHVSEPITDEDLSTAVFGTALISPKPLTLTCDDGSRRPPTPSKTRPPGK